MILLRFATNPDIIDNYERYPERESAVTAFVEWVRREDFPSLELFSRVKEFDEEMQTTTKNLALIGLNGDLITHSKRPKF